MQDTLLTIAAVAEKTDMHRQSILHHYLKLGSLTPSYQWTGEGLVEYDEGRRGRGVRPVFTLDDIARWVEWRRRRGLREVMPHSGSP